MSVPARQAAAMDRMYRYTRHIYDLTRKPYLLGRDRLIERLDLDAGGRVLEMGCGTGRNLIALARRYPRAELYGFDISEEMLKTARASVDRAGLSERIRLAQGDATDFDPAAAFGIARFDRVYYSYALSMIPPWRAALRHGLALTAPDGRYGVVDFGFCDGLGGLVRSSLHGWLRLFHVQPRAELEAELAAIAVEQQRRLTFERPYRGYAQLAIVR
ncbi:MAG: class I SAM-dependent methyltransferase [Ancalomicrobiaceae bacterium]|nr:class I SAM-dependent methyltransferase [Ancalomicrobiaceae bacterium]